jgi:hypothetical protein
MEAIEAKSKYSILLSIQLQKRISDEKKDPEANAQLKCLYTFK